MWDLGRVTVDDYLYTQAKEQGNFKCTANFKEADIKRLELAGFIFTRKAKTSSSGIIQATANWENSFSEMKNPDYTQEGIVKTINAAIEKAEATAVSSAETAEDIPEKLESAKMALLDDFPQKIINDMREKEIPATQAMYLWLTATLHNLLK